MLRQPAKALSRCLASALVGAYAFPALAQSPPPGKPPTPPEIMEPPNENPTTPSDPGADGTKPKEPLSKQLEQGEGVLEPPREIDPQMKKPVPDDFQGRTPVIPPPGSPGGNSDVKPK